MAGPLDKSPAAPNGQSFAALLLVFGLVSIVGGRLLASRAAAERFAEEALKLFLLRRCTDDLNQECSENDPCLTHELLGREAWAGPQPGTPPEKT